MALVLGWVGLLAVARGADAAAEGESVVKGVNPAENLTKFEVLPKFALVDDALDITVTSVTFKYDRALGGGYGFNVELPLARFDSPGGDDEGIGDLNLRMRKQIAGGRWTYIAGVEVVLPTASHDTLGAGKYQTNFVGAAVYPLSGETFVAGVAKQYFSVAGKSSRADIVQGQYRVLLAHSIKSGWWFLADPQLWVDFERDARSQFSLDVEVGKMVRPLTGVWLRAGGRLGGNWHREEWSVSGGVRFISF